MALSKFSIYAYALSLISIILACGCTDNTIEGLSANSSGVFKVSKSSYSNTTLNDCFISSSGNYGTTFIVKLEYQGSEVVNKIGYAYKFSSGATGTVASVSYTDLKSGGSGTFRGTSGLANLQVTHCVRFGTSTSIEYTYTITTTLNKTYTSIVTVTKPVGAN